MPTDSDKPTENDRIDLTYAYEVCAWARHFNTSEKHVKEAVAAVGNRADLVREHLASSGPNSKSSDRPSGS